MLLAILDDLREEIRAGTFVVGLEPSCISVFRDEMSDLLGNDKDAERLAKQSYLFSEFLTKHAPDYAPPKLDGVVVVHQHCHHKALLDAPSERTLLEKLGAEFRVLDDGCCGMAGAFGFEEGHYDVSQALAERALLPAVREATASAVIVADGFSCREQISQNTDRQALHPAQLLKLAIDRRGAPVPAKPELACMPDARVEAARARRLGAQGLAVACVAGVAVALAVVWSKR
jgi:Fe-S oxidoreductase